MQLRDAIGLPLRAMWQQKVRVLLTTLGVVFGAFVLAASLSIGQGVQDTITTMAKRTELLRKIQLHPNWETVPASNQAPAPKVDGQMSDERRGRLAKTLADVKLQAEGKKVLRKLDPEMLKRLAALEGVESIIPIVRISGDVHVLAKSQGPKTQGVQIGSTNIENAELPKRIVSGRFFQSNQEEGVLISEYLLYRLGIRDESAFQEGLGKKIKLEFAPHRQSAGFGIYFIKPDGSGPSPQEAQILEKVKGQLPGLVPKLELSALEKLALTQAMAKWKGPAPAATVIELPVVGVFRLKTEEEQKGPWNPLETDSEVVLACDAARDLFFRLPEHENQSLQETVLVADRQESVKDLLEATQKMGLRGYGFLEHIERERMLYLMIFAGMTCVAAVAMIVAALGITNTMFMSVLERTKEIGIMKAVGASNGQMLIMFLIEGTLIGLAGGLAGLFLTWCASFPGDAWIRSMVFRELKVDLKESLFVFPIWLLIAVPFFSVVVTTLAALGPARRAANIDPVVALRHE